MILELQAIDTFYGLGHILHGLSMNVSDGEIVALWSQLFPALRRVDRLNEVAP